MDDTLYRLANTTFDRMLQDPASHRFPVFAGQRVRMADVIVELVGREPACVVRTAFAVLTSMTKDAFDASKFDKQQFALVETALAPVFAVSDSNETVVDATHRFVAQGGAWAPSSHLHGPLMMPHWGAESARVCVPHGTAILRDRAVEGICDLRVF